MLDKVQVKILNKAFYQSHGLPKRATEHSAGFDLYACIEAPLVCEPQAVHLIDTGIACYINHPHYAAVIMPRSGLGHKHGIILGNTVGLIDADYQGPLKVSLWNRSETAFEILPGDRIAQLVFMPVALPIFETVEAFDETARGVGGFGSSGTHSQPEVI